MKQILTCMKCESALSPPLSVYLEENSNVEYGLVGHIRTAFRNSVNETDVVPNFSSCSDIIPRGFAFKPKGSLEYYNPVDTIPPEHIYWLNLNDIIHVTKNKNWVIGCCGAYGSSMPNLSCRCGEFAGFEISECYSEKVFLPYHQTTMWKTQNQ